jgi:two-component system chemotaxis response regulator CheB
VRPPIKVLVVDDSALMRKLVPQMLERDPQISVVGTAMDGEFALRRIARLQPDVITLDLNMPRMDGLQVLRRLRQHHPRVNAVVLSAHSTEGASATFKALQLGAVDFLAKPAGSLKIGAVAGELIAKIKAAAAAAAVALPRPAAIRRGHEPARRQDPAGVLVIGASTGGPNALQYLLSRLPADFPAAILVVQHMPAGFTHTFAQRLHQVSRLEVKEAEQGDLLLAGRVLVAPGNRHLRVARSGLREIAVLSNNTDHLSHCPSIDVLFTSAARNCSSSVTALLLTGMGSDGARGMGEVLATGGLTLAQGEKSSVVFGMARRAIQLGHATRVAELEALPALLSSLWQGPEAQLALCAAGR